MEQAKEAANAVSEFFQGNPFASPVGQKIEQATDGALPSENWALNIEICDMISMTDEGPRDATRALKKRLQNQMGKNNTSVMYTLTVLETAVKNCDRRFHVLIAQKDFINELVRLIGPKFDPPQVVQEKVLSLIQAWADAFRGHEDLKGVCEVYDDLKSKGVEFPMTDLDTMAPILTPQRTVGQNSPTHAAQPPQHAPIPRPASGSLNPGPEQLAKLRSELDIVNGNMRVLREMLTELAPGHEDPDDFQLLNDLYKTCRSMQRRVMELLSAVANEEVTNELLLVNDELNNVFIKYERYMKNRNQPQGQQQPKETDSSLIDFGGANNGGDLSAQLAGMSVAGAVNVADIPSAAGGGGGKDEFDMFSQTRSANYEQNKKEGSNYGDNSAAGLDQINVSLGEAAQQKGDNERDLGEMEEWLKSQPAAENRDTSKDFDNFLAARAESAQQLPSTQAQKPEEAKEDKMFAL